MVTGQRIYNKITNFIRIIAIWIFKILFSKAHMKTSIFKRVYYAINGGFNADQTVLYDLKHHKNEYISEFDMHKSRRINEPYNFILNNKLVCSDLLKQYIEVPHTLCIKKKNMIISGEEKARTNEDVLEIIKKYKSVFLKPISIGKGRGVYRINYNNNRYYIDEKEVTLEDVLKVLDSHKEWFISNTVKQSKFLDNIYDKTSNTIRLITTRNINTGDIDILYAVLRIGTKETIPVDNGSQGGLVAKIDLNTGKLSRAKSIQRICDLEKHPDSNNQIEGLTIPNWKEIKKTFVELMEKLPYLYFIAWDILLTDNGPVVIEANASSGLNVVQVFGGQRQDVIGQFYKDHKIIK